MTQPEPKSPYHTKPGGGGHIAPVGMGAVAHFVGNKDNESWGYLGKHLATCAATGVKMMFDGHADATMHSFFSVLGAARADEEDFRSYLDYAKTWIILSESHDGQGLIDQPFGCQRNSTCSISRDRSAYTHTAILLLSIPKRRLLITGADYAQPAAPTTANKRPNAGDGGFWADPSAPRPVVRQARTLSAENLAKLDRALLKALVKLSDSDALKPIPMTLSKTPENVWLCRAVSDGTLTFQTVKSMRRIDFKWDDLSRGEHAVLALLVARLIEESRDAQAMAGVYLEGLGRVEKADQYFEKAGEESRNKLERLFE